MKDKGYSVEWLERLKSNSNIVSTISRYLTLNRKGSTYWACCPFHHEKTPSFAVNEQSQFYHCFGCGESGDVIKFVEKLEGTDFVGAVKILAEHAGMEVPEFDGDASYLESKKHRENLQNICREAALFYNKMLVGSQGAKAREYLNKRGVLQSTITRLGIGYSPNWTGVVTYLKNKGFQTADILESGVCGERDGKLFDEMATRVVFPVIDHRGRVVGFSGRALNEGAFAKYKNTKQTPLFNKSNNIYCINFLRKARLNKNYAILVEGQMDVVALNQAGFDNAIATMGTAFNKNHVATLSRFVDGVVVCFDGDGAGKKATAKSLEPLMAEGLDIRVLELPEKLDPDEYIKKYGADEYQKLIDNSLPVYEFEIKHEASKYDLSNRDNISKFIDASLQIILSIPKESEKQVYIDLIAQIGKVPKETLLRQLNGMRRNAVKNDTQSQRDIDIKTTQTKNYKAEQYVLACVVHKKSFAKGIELDDFVNNNFKTIFEFLEKNNYPIISSLYDSFDVEDNNDLKQLIDYDFSKIVNQEKEFEGCLNTIKLDKLIAKQNQINAQLQTCTNEEVKLALIKRAGELSKEINEKKTFLNKVG